MKPKTFERWCEDSGRRWTGCRDADEFFKNAVAYEAYREAVIDGADDEPFHVIEPGAKGGDDETS